jgi:hypothetical protein
MLRYFDRLQHGWEKLIAVAEKDDVVTRHQGIPVIPAMVMGNSGDSTFRFFKRIDSRMRLGSRLIEKERRDARDERPNPMSQQVGGNCDGHP